LVGAAVRLATVALVFAAVPLATVALVFAVEGDDERRDPAGTHPRVLGWFLASYSHAAASGRDEAD
jgi:hypothetical protein